MMILLLLLALQLLFLFQSVNVVTQTSMRNSEVNVAETVANGYV